MAVSLELIKELRETTGIATMSCKKALDETGGDMEKAIEMLRKKGELKSAERAERSATEGVIAIAQGSGKAGMVKLACETDFVARNEDFVKAAGALAERALKEGDAFDSSSEASNLNIKMGEKIAVAEVAVISSPIIGTYVHSNKKIGVMVGLDGGDTIRANDVAMHIAASKPEVISPDEIASEKVEKEKEIWRALLKTEGKPEAIWDNIMKGKEKKFREERALLTQAFVKNPDQTVAQYLENAKVVAMKRFAL